MYRIKNSSFNILNLLHPSIFFVVLYIFYLMIYPFFVYPLTEVKFFKINTTTYIIIIIYLIFFITGVFIPYFTLIKRNLIYVGRLKNDLVSHNKVFYFFFFLGVCFFIFFYLKAGKIPILAQDIEVARVELKKGLGKYVLLGTAFLNISLIFRYTIECYYKKLSIFSYLYLFVASLLILGVGFRGPVAYLILSILLSTTFVREIYRMKRRIPIKLILLGILIVVFVSIAGYYRYTRNIDVNALFSIFWTMAVNVFNLNVITTYVPNQYDYFYGQTFINDFGAVFHFHNNGFTGVYLKNLFGLIFRGEGITVTAPGEAYINFGILGIVGHATFLGFVSSIIYTYMIRKKNFSSIILLIVFAINFPRIVISGITPTFFFSLGPQIFVTYLYIFTCRILRKGE